MKNKIKNKGMLFYTLIGLMVICLVAVIAIHLINTSYVSNQADLVAQRRFNAAIYDTQADLHDVVRHAIYPVVWRVGHDVDSEGVNVYLKKSEGEMLSSLEDQFTSQMNDDLCHFSDNCSNNVDYTFRQDVIDVYINPVTEDNVEITGTEYGLSITVNVSMRSESGKKYSYQNDKVPITVEVPVRLVQMREKAKIFHQNYKTNVQITTTIALYIRALLSSKDPNGNGSFLKEGDLSYDPFDPVVRMDLEQLKKDGVQFGAVGSVPAATYLSETYLLGEPSFLPPGIDINSPSYNPTNLVNMLRGSFDLKGAMNCTSLPEEKQQECEDMSDEAKIRQRAKDLSTHASNLNKVNTLVVDWINKYRDRNTIELKEITCDQFKEETEKVINELMKEFDANSPKEIIDPSVNYSKGTGELGTEVLSNSDLINNVSDAVDELNIINQVRLSLISGNPCKVSDNGDCRPCPDASTDCGRPDCDFVDCSGKCNDGSDCGCTQGDEIFDSRPVKVDCYPTGSEMVYIDQCNCMCYPNQKLRDDVSTQLKVVYEAINDKVDKLRTQVKELNDRADTVKASNEKLNQVDSLLNNPVAGYDVISSTSFIKVKYDSPTDNVYFGQHVTFPGTRCYYNPTWQVRNNGTCADSKESTGMYAAQVSAAVICCGVFQPCCKVVDYARKYFPIIYHVTGEYNINEKIIDDRGRMMLHNVYAGDSDLYGYNLTQQLFHHVAPEFVIYKNYHVDVSSMTGERVLIYVDMDEVTDTNKRSSAKKIMDSFTDPSCKGEGC